MISGYFVCYREYERITKLLMEPINSLHCGISANSHQTDYDNDDTSVVDNLTTFYIKEGQKRRKGPSLDEGVRLIQYIKDTVCYKK